MKVSIIIPNFNGAKYIETCFKSLHNQEYNDYEIIFVDNGSEDDSCSIALDNYSQIKLIALDANYGFSKAVNEGIKASSSDFVVLLNNDTELEKEWLNNLIKCIESYDNIFSCSSKMIRYYEREKTDDAGDGYNIFGWSYKKGDGLPNLKYNRDGQVFASCAGAAIYRRKIFDEIGYFDENFFAYLEDMDISYRARIHGYKNVYCSDAVVYHIASATSGSRYNAFKARLIGRNSIYVIYKNMPLLQLFINSPFLIAGIIIKIIFYWKIGLSKEYTRGVKEAFLNIRSGKIQKVKYKNKNLLSYLKIEWAIILNTFKFVAMKVFKIAI